MRRLTIRVDAKLDTELDRIAHRTGRTKSAFARDAIRRHLARIRYRELRRRILPFAKAQALLTDEVCFRALS